MTDQSAGILWDGFVDGGVESTDCFLYPEIDCMALHSFEQKVLSFEDEDALNFCVQFLHATICCNGIMGVVGMFFGDRVKNGGNNGGGGVAILIPLSTPRYQPDLILLYHIYFSAFHQTKAWGTSSSSFLFLVSFVRN